MIKPFHGGNRGSNPRGDATSKPLDNSLNPLQVRLFSLTSLSIRQNPIPPNSTRFRSLSGGKVVDSIGLFLLLLCSAARADNVITAPPPCPPDTCGTLVWTNTAGTPKVKPSFTFPAHVVNVYDGDTMDVAVNPFPKKKGYDLTMDRRLRLARINAPEIKDPDPVNAKAALKSRDWVRSKVLDKDVVVVIGRSDTYERDVSEVYFDDAGAQKNISDEELRLGLAVPYPPKGDFQ